MPRVKTELPFSRADEKWLKYFIIDVNGGSASEYS